MDTGRCCIVDDVNMLMLMSVYWLFHGSLWLTVLLSMLLLMQVWCYAAAAAAADDDAAVSCLCLYVITSYFWVIRCLISMRFPSLFSVACVDSQCGVCFLCIITVAFCSVLSCCLYFVFDETQLYWFSLNVAQYTGTSDGVVCYRIGKYRQPAIVIINDFNSSVVMQTE